jgi:hypothetical protein
MHPYVVPDFNAFLAGMLGWPGIKEAMDLGTMMNKKYCMWDIKDGTVMQEISGIDRLYEDTSTCRRETFEVCHCSGNQ